MRELLIKALELDEFNLAVVTEIKGNPSKITFYSNQGEILLSILIGSTLENEKMNISPSKLKIVSKVKKLNVLSDILDLDLVDDASDNYILVSKSDDSQGVINFINKFGDKINFKINVKKILEVSND